MSAPVGLDHRSLNVAAPRTKVLLSLVAFFTFLSPLQAAFNEALWGARPAALAGAFTAVADDANAPAYNPAGISMMTDDEITFMYAQLFSGLNLQTGTSGETSRLALGYFSYVPNIREKKWGSFGVSWTNFEATNLYREDAFALTYADSFQFERFSGRPVLSVGGNLKMLRRAFSTDSRTANDPVFRSGRDSNAFTIDIGAIFRPKFERLPGFSVGAAIQNATEPDLGLQETDRVPARYSVGIAYQDETTRLINPSLDISRRDGRTLVTGAWEAWVAPDVLALRVGGNRDQFGGGIGYQFSLFGGLRMALDYALLWPFNVDGTNGSHRVSLTSRF